MSEQDPQTHQEVANQVIEQYVTTPSRVDQLYDEPGALLPDQVNGPAFQADETEARLVNALVEEGYRPEQTSQASGDRAIGEAAINADLVEEPTNHEAREKMSVERLREIMKGSIYVANIDLSGGRTPLKYNTFSPTKTDLPLLDSMDRFFPSKEIENSFTENGISELVTITEAARLLPDNLEPGEVWPGDGEHSGEPIYAVQYMTLTGNSFRSVDPDEKIFLRQRFPYTDRPDLTSARYDQKTSNDAKPAESNQTGRETDFHYMLLLPETEAKELQQAMIKNPESARDLGDLIVTGNEETRDQIGRLANVDQATWDSRKPRYDIWREINGGVDRMAFLTAPGQSVDQARIVEY